MQQFERDTQLFGGRLPLKHDAESFSDLSLLIAGSGHSLREQLSLLLDERTVQEEQPLQRNVGDIAALSRQCRVRIVERRLDAVRKYPADALVHSAPGHLVAQLLRRTSDLGQIEFAGGSQEGIPDAF